MNNNITYNFKRSTSSKLPPRFKDVSSRLEEIGIYGACLEHPRADWNHITLTTVDNNINPRALEEIFNKLGYNLIS